MIELLVVWDVAFVFGPLPEGFPGTRGGLRGVREEYDMLSGGGTSIWFVEFAAFPVVVVAVVARIVVDAAGWTTSSACSCCCGSSLISGRIKGGGERAGFGATLGGVVGVSLAGDVGDTSKSS